jgi:hypothetical protein
MRRTFSVVLRGVTAVSLMLAMAASLSAAPKNQRERDPVNPIVKIIRKIVRSLGDGLTIPTP